MTVDLSVLTPLPAMPRLAASPTVEQGGLVYGTWSITAARYTDHHQHAEANTVLEGSLEITYAGATHVVGPGSTHVVPAGVEATYAAPVFAKMLWSYGPGERGTALERYEEL